MKMLAIGDPHGKLPKGLNKIVRKEKIDIIVCTGDIPPVPLAFRKGKINYFPKKFTEKANKLFEEIVRKLCSFKKPVFILRGNMYLTGARDKLTRKIFSKYENLYYRQTGMKEIQGKNFVLFDMSFEPHMMHNKIDRFMQKQLDLNKPREIKLNEFMKRLRKKSSDIILVSHAPPYGYLDKTKWGPKGSKILLRAIKKYQPKIVLCGHIHEDKGIKKIGKSIVYNLGHDGDYKVLEI